MLKRQGPDPFKHRNSDDRPTWYKEMGGSRMGRRTNLVTLAHPCPERRGEYSVVAEERKASQGPLKRELVTSHVGWFGPGSWRSGFRVSPSHSHFYLLRPCCTPPSGTGKSELGQFIVPSLHCMFTLTSTREQTGLPSLEPCSRQAKKPHITTSS